MNESAGSQAQVGVDYGVGRGATLVSVGGRIGIEEANELQRRFDEVFRMGRPWIILSLKDVEFICSAGMGTLLAGVGEARKRGGEVIFTDISTKTKTIFEFLDVWDFITSATDVESALTLIDAARGEAPDSKRAVANPTALDDRELKERLRAGLEASKNGRLKEALQQFNAVLKADKDNTTALVWKANALERLGQWGEADRLYQRVCEIGRGDPRLLGYARDRHRLITARLKPQREEEAAALAAERTWDGFRKTQDQPAFLSPARTVPADAPAFLECHHTWDAGLPFEVGNEGGDRRRGGGFYLWVGGKGIVLDPGTYFLAYFAAAGRRLVDIDAVVISASGPGFAEDAELLVETIAKYNALKIGVTKRVEVFVHAAHYQRAYGWLSAASGAVSDLNMLYADHSYGVGDVEFRTLKTGYGKASEEGALGITFGKGDLGYLPLGGNEEGEATFDDYAVARGKVLLISVRPGCWQQPAGAFFGVELPFPGRIAAAVDSIRPAVSLLARAPYAWDVVSMSQIISKMTRIRCIPADLGLQINISPPGVIVGDNTYGPHEIEPAMGNGGRILYRPGG